MGTVSVLVPIVIASANILASSIAEPLAADFALNGVTYALQEVAWAASTSYAIGDKKFRATTHKVYECQLATGAARTIGPESDGAYWIEYGPTQKYAPFDTVTNTKAYGNGSITYTMSVGFCNAICFYGMDGANLSVQGYTDSTKTTQFYNSGTINVQEPAFDEYDWLFGQIYPLDRYVIEGLVPYPSAVFDVTISAASGVLVTLGTMAFGDLVSLVPSDNTWQGPTVGATAQPTSYSYVKVNDDGTIKVTRRFGSTDLHVELQIPLDSADTSLQIVQRVLDIPACWVGSDLTGYEGLNTFGIATGKLAYNDGFAKWTIDVKGLS